MHALSELRVVDFAQNQGAAAALCAAIDATRMDWVLLIDSDGQFPIDNVERFLEDVTVRKVIVVPGKLVNIVAN